MRKVFSGGSVNGQITDFAVEHGRIQEVRPHCEGDERIDIAGTTVLPGFVDAHCHILPTGLDLLKLNLRECQSQQAMLDALRDWARDHSEQSYIHGVQYDQTRWAGAEHLTRHDLDRVVSDRPVLLRHSNGHASVANSRALEVAGITKETSDPPGGEFRRDSSGNPDGVLLERAHEIVTHRAPHPTHEEAVAAILRAGETLAGMGITSATDMMTGRWDLVREIAAYREAAERGCAIRMRLYLQWKPVLGPDGATREQIEDALGDVARDRLDVRGLKIFADGAIGSATAAIYSTYRTTGGYGQLIYKPERLAEMIAQADAADWPLAIHTIGDHSTDLVMEGYERTQDPTRHRIEHAMILSDEQRERLARLGSHVTMQPEFLMRFGHAYRAQLQPEVVGGLKPVHTLMNLGVPLSFNSDRPIVPGDPWDGIDAAITRPEGFDPAENISERAAIRLWTEGGARANSDHEAGAVREGAWADFQVYQGEPAKSTPKTTYRAGEQVG